MIAAARYPNLGTGRADVGRTTRECRAVSCAHCKRNLAGVAVIFAKKPPVCGRSDCLAWASRQQPLARVFDVSFQAPPVAPLRPAA